MRRALRLVGFATAGVAALAILLLAGVYGFSSQRFNRTYAVEVQPLAISTLGTDGTEMAALVERGAHVARIRGCLDCHAGDGGGAEFADDPAFGRLWASNLTRGDGGIAGDYTEGDWDRAVRHGIGRSGKPLYFMPSQEFWALSDEDMAALIAYFRALEPVDRTPLSPKPGPLARLLYLVGDLPLVPAELVNHEAARPRAPQEAPTAEFGRYLATGCTGCHGEGYSGGKIPGGAPGWPPAANITPDEETGIGPWSRADFIHALREGVRPDGTEIDPVMPISMTRHMTDEELTALYAYLRTVDPKPFGNR